MIADRRLRRNGRPLRGMEKLESRRLLAAELGGLEFIPGELLVQYVAGADPGHQAQVRSAAGAVRSDSLHALTESVQAQEGYGGLELLKLGEGMGVEQAMRALAKNPWVTFVEPNYIYRKSAVSDDPYYAQGNLWGMYGDDLPAAVGPSGTTNQFGIGAEKLWNDNLTGSSSIVVGILDEGVQVTHPDLINNMWVNPYEVPDDGIDNDANGYVDDVHGWDFVNNDKTVYDAGQDSHGTHVAGTIGGEGRNGVGVAGVNWDVTMISLKFLGPDGGTTSAAVRALDYLTDLKVRHGMNIVASNNSWGGGGYSAALHAAINRAAKQNILFVAAAGNSTANNDTTASYPSNYDSTQASPGESAASYDSVIAVASITNTGGLSSFSNFGATQVDIGAPGSGIWSTVPENSYSSFSGTSMATPHVTGAVALYAAAQGRTVSGAEIRSAILETAVPTASLAGRTVTGGRLNVASAVSRSSLFDFDQKEYAIPATVGLSLFDAAANLNSAAVETITVAVRGTTETTAESVTLTETSAGSGRFAGTIALAAGSPVADGRLQVIHGDVLTATYGARNQVATAKVDGLAPQISGLSANPLAINATVSWSTDEPATAEVFYGLTPESLLQRVASTSPKTAHELTLTGLATGTTYHYQVRVRDGVGNMTTSSVNSFATGELPAVLLVDDDQGEPYESYFHRSLQAVGYAYDTWDAFSIGRTPTAAELAGYKIVIWTTGTDYLSSTAGLSAGEQSALQTYLDGGGRVFLSGQDILYNRVSDAFRLNYLKVDAFVDDIIVSNHTATGVSGNPISEGMSVGIQVPAGYQALYADAVVPVAGAQGLFSHGQSGALYPFTGVSFRGDYSAGGFGVVFSTVPFETMQATAADPNNQDTFLRRTLAFLEGDVSRPAVVVSPPSPSAFTSEARGSVSFSVVLSTAPTAEVTIPIASSDLTEGTVVVESIRFTPENWGVPQAVVVTGVDDRVDDGDVVFTIRLGAAVSTDPAYQGIEPPDVTLANRDDDVAGVTVAGLSGGQTSELGTSVTFTVRLDSEPTAEVRVPIASSDTTEGVASTAAVVFDATNWNVPQTVTVTGVDDASSDGPIEYSVVIGGVVSADPRYAGLNPADIALVNIDNEPAEVLMFADSFEVAEWNGLWVEDSQNDWFRSTQRATDGRFSAEIDGAASGATLTLRNNGVPINTLDMDLVTLRFDWLIESSFDLGEFVALDVSANGGVTWTQNVRALRGDQSAENAWIPESVDLTPFKGSDVRVRFRGTMSDSAEDANVDNVRIVGRPAGPRNQAPVARGDAGAVLEDGVLTVNAPGLLANDSDAEGSSLTAALVSGPSNGTVTLDASGRYVYIPAANFNGVDRFTYKASDGNSDSEVATVTLTVTPVNDAPIADGQTGFEVDQDSSRAISLIASDVDGDALNYLIVTPPANGTLSGSGSQLVYTPNAGYSGPDGFTFKASDGGLESNVANWSIVVVPQNPPVAEGQSVVTEEDRERAITLVATDQDNDELSYSIVSQPAHGALSGSGSSWTYRPAANFFGSDSFTFRVNDGRFDSNIATVSIDVTPVNDAPRSADQILSVPFGRTLPVTLVGTDVDGDTLAYEIVSGPTSGVLSGSGASRSYTPNSGFSGDDSFTYKVNDGNVDSTVATVRITVQPQTQTVLFEDSFEIGEWNGQWVEDSQNDWYRSNQRATAGTRSAEVDGGANNATLTLRNGGLPLSTLAYSQVSLSYGWFIESTWDTGEYIALDVSTDGGTTWTNNVRRINGNQSPENVWVQESVDLTPYRSSNLRIRFRALVSDSVEDGNVDNVRIIGIGTAEGAAAQVAGKGLVTALPDGFVRRASSAPMWENQAPQPVTLEEFFEIDPDLVATGDARSAAARLAASDAFFSDYQPEGETGAEQSLGSSWQNLL